MRNMYTVFDNAILDYKTADAQAWDNDIESQILTESLHLWNHTPIAPYTHTSVDPLPFYSGAFKLLSWGGHFQVSDSPN